MSDEAVAVAHIGIAVDDLEAARERYAALLGISASPIEEVPSEGVRVSFFDLGNCRLELLGSSREDSAIARFLKKGRRGVHHIALTRGERDLGEVLAELRARDVPVLDESPRRGAEGSEVFFVHPRGADGVLFEFIREGDSAGEEDSRE